MNSDTRYSRLKSLRLCVKCGKVPPLDDWTRCASCRDKVKNKYWNERVHSDRIIANSDLKIEKLFSEERFNKVKEINNIDLAYLAGFIDGEGCIGVHKFKRKGRKNEYSYLLNVSIPNTNKEIIDWIYDITNIGSTHYGRENGYNRKPVNVIRFVCNEAFVLLSLVIKYLKIKHKQAELAIHYYAKLRAGAIRSRFLPDDVIERQKNIFEAFAWMNRRGTIESEHIDRYNYEKKTS